jgi:trans-2,3-dihydro-3-hydroxyanthranilate isomerase
MIWDSGLGFEYRRELSFRYLTESRVPSPESRVPTMKYLHLDVFTDRPLEGNQLAVFPEPGGLSAADMQAIAREMNFSESTFIFPPDGDTVAGAGRARMRIFTPGAELPMAGHPTIGSTFALAALGTIGAGTSNFVFELGVGPTPVSLEWSNGALAFAWMTQLLPAFGEILSNRIAFSAAVGVDHHDLVTDLPVQVVSCGVPFLFAALTSRQAVDRVEVDRKALARCFRDAGLEDLPTFFFTTEPGASDDATVYSRMLAPGFGITEDPATGGASGPLGCYLVHYELVRSEAAQEIVSLQGVAMGRPSRIHIAIDARDGGITRVRVGGRAVLVGRGELDL